MNWHVVLLSSDPKISNLKISEENMKHDLQQKPAVADLIRLARLSNTISRLIRRDDDRSVNNMTPTVMSACRSSIQSHALLTLGAVVYSSE